MNAYPLISKNVERGDLQKTTHYSVCDRLEESPQDE